MDKNEIILDNYKKEQKKFTNFSKKLEILLRELLDEEGISYQNISTRTKDINSLKKKIESKEKYEDLEQITDIIGCRIITYFESDLEDIIKIIKKEFDVDEKNSIDKKEILEHDRFGYLSYHIICKINKNRKKLIEYKKYINIKFEIQIRTVLQHAWAEIEHDIGYKSNIEVPKQFRRRFSRIAGLLELVDDEFSKIKKEIFEYTENLTPNNLLNTDINANSIKKYINDNKIIYEMNQEIGKALNLKEKLIEEEELHDIKINFILQNIQEMKEYKTIKDINNEILKEKEFIVKFTIEWINSKPNNYKNFTKTTGLLFSIFFFIVKSVVEKNFNNKLLELFFRNNIEDVSKAKEIYREIKGIKK
ncbi:GTP pyrophosphokinase [Aliarcobacter butzleri]|uniref:GTP pyrophosphokinase n=1 Tax=Aliarcobacter butzleri TaxID=28197 RepID=UPI001161D04E|nr:hypothetical protein [Aliarcobacter butzleri]QDM00764.1 hypothetical protein FM022_02620 [Aliarcobacter butzleri]